MKWIVLVMMSLLTSVSLARTDFVVDQLKDGAIVQFSTGLKVYLDSKNREKIAKYKISSNGGSESSWKKVKRNIVLRKRVVDPLKGILNDSTVNKKSNLFVIQFYSQVINEYEEVLKDRGIEVYNYIPHNALLVKMNIQKRFEIQSLPFVRGLTQLKTSDKYSEETLNPSSLGKWLVMPVKLGKKSELQNLVKSLGGEIIHPTKNSILFEALLNKAQLNKVLSSNLTIWVEKWQEIEVDVNNALKLGGTAQIQSRGVSVTGVGVRGHVFEGIYSEHGDFADKETRKAPIAVGNGNPASHGQATYGIVFGDGAGNANAKGLLPDAQGYYTNYSSIQSTPPGTGANSRYELVKKLIEEHEVMFQTASWGYSRTTSYNARSLEMDQLIFDLDIPITQSQSNAGTRSSRPQAWAKNIISVGGLKHFDNDNFTDDTWNRTASIGPASDGRIKPDIAAFYDKILTTSSTGYNTGFGGTSGATPIVAGHVGLIIEMFAKGMYGNKVRSPGAGIFKNRPHSSTTKALLINGARQWEFNGATHDRTRVHQGWGFPNIAAHMINKADTLIVDETKRLKNLESASYTIDVKAGKKELKATLVYLDPVGSISSSIQLVNNLDLKITSPKGVVYHGNHGLLENMYSLPEGQSDSLNNVENIFIKSPEVGSWRVEVIASEINEDGHLETKQEKDADFALVVSSN